MAKLNDAQTILLSAASQRDSGSIFPLPDRFAAANARVTKAIGSLVPAALAEERESSAAEFIYRTDGDISFGLFITPAGLAAIGVSDEDIPVSPPVVADRPVRTTKSASVLAMLGRDDGATLAELTAATGWLPHTTRAALTGIRKKGHAIVRTVRDGTSYYRIVAVA